MRDTAIRVGPASVRPSSLAPTRSSVSGNRKRRRRTPSSSTTCTSLAPRVRQTTVASPPRQLSSASLSAAQLGARTRRCGAAVGGTNARVTTWSAAAAAKPGDGASHSGLCRSSTKSPGRANGRSTLPRTPRKDVAVPGIWLQLAAASCGQCVATITRAHSVALSRCSDSAPTRCGEARRRIAACRPARHPGAPWARVVLPLTRVPNGVARAFGNIGSPHTC
jgi:hypothetical protein